ncbi:hypothetical protein GCK72_006240 [Caenorhabditis remanei]|uniref:Uncharacterized protein n=1 Tax=Caenorhabditis remanei TaxID=31234 RepID=A0A6A5HI21_CAERE|nr:hypothetical protein GCK72_006240 [Caenorhabditis remanei]KAF1766284.1 hypothetical protein GCK72_006240 [Caenorhabditis remanei]
MDSQKVSRKRTKRIASEQFESVKNQSSAAKKSKLEQLEEKLEKVVMTEEVGNKKIPKAKSAKPSEIYKRSNKKIDYTSPFIQIYTTSEPSKGEIEAEKERVAEVCKDILTEFEKHCDKEFAEISAGMNQNVFKKTNLDRPKYAPLVMKVSGIKKIKVPPIPEAFKEKIAKIPEFFEPLMANVDAKDEEQLTNLPSVHETTDDALLHKYLHEHYENGIHGDMPNKFLINREILFNVMKTLIPQTSNPDLLYYALYQTFPNYGSQSEFSKLFPSLRRTYAFFDRELIGIETWKSQEDRVCIHANRKQFEITYPDTRKNYLVKAIDLPIGNGDETCSEACYKGLTKDKIISLMKKFVPEGLNRVKLYIRKLTPLKESPFLNALLKQNNEELLTNFCHIAKLFPERECSAWFEVLLNVSTQPVGNNLEDINPLASFTARDQAFRRSMGPEKKKQGGTLDICIPATPCDHLGPCGPDVPLCSCKVACSVYCNCDSNCRRKFPGCNCKGGTCRTTRCPCFLAQYECTELTCGPCLHNDDGSDQFCKNNGISRGSFIKIIVKKSGIAGNGAFIEQDVAKDEYIGEYVGERVSEEESERRGKLQALKSSYLFGFGDGKEQFGSIDACRAGNSFRFVNHSAKPNCRIRYALVKGELRIGFYAERNLKAGEELTFDYAYEDEHAQRFFKLAPEDRVPKFRCFEKKKSKIEKVKVKKILKNADKVQKPKTSF